MSTSVETGMVAVPGGDVWYKAVGLDSTETPLLALHGGPGYPSTDLQPLEALGTERPVILYDQLGCGNSRLPEQASKDNSHLWSIDRFVKEVASVREQLGLDEVHLLGLSWGGSLAVEYMLQEKPSGVKSLTLASPLLSASLFQREVVGVADQLGAGAYATLQRHAEAGDLEHPEYKRLFDEFDVRYILGREPDDFPEDQQVALQASLDGFEGEVAETLTGKSEFSPTGPLADFEKVDQLHNLGSLPVLYTCGRADYITPASVQVYHEATPGSQFTIFENSAHFAHFTEKAAFLSRLSSFLRDSENSAATATP